MPDDQFGDRKMTRLAVMTGQAPLHARVHPEPHAETGGPVLTTSNRRSLFVFGCVAIALLILQPAWYFWAICGACAVATAWIALDERRNP